MTISPGFLRQAGLVSAFLSLTGFSPAFSGSSLAAESTNHAPWHHSKPVGVPFTVYGVNNVPDLHGDPSHADLILFIAGNQFMTMPDLVRAFKHRHPEIRHVFYETLPPGILARQIREGGLTIGNLHLRLSPDVYESGKVRMAQMVRQGLVEKSSVTPYAKNKLGIMVQAGNPDHIQTLSDLGSPKLRLSLPNPKWEGIGKQIRLSLKKAGGPPLVHRIFVTKLNDKTTYLTHIHHRETAVRILDGTSDAGITWISEILFQKSIGHPIGLVRIPDKLNTEALYEAGILKHAPHQSAARAWIAFLASDEGRKIYEKYGFTPKN